MTLSLPTGRNLVILPRQRAVRHGIYGASLGPAWPAKDPGGTNVYGADFMWVFDGAPAQVDAEIWPSAAVQLLEQGILGTAFVARIAGGTDGQPALILLTATSADGRVEPRVIALPIVGTVLGSPSISGALGGPASTESLGDPSSTLPLGDAS